MSLSPTCLTARELLYSPTEPICIIFKKIGSITMVMQRELRFTQKITNNIAKIKNSKTTGTALIIIVATVLLLSSPVVGVVSVWADNFFGTSGPDTLIGTENDDKIFGRAGSDNLRGEGGDDYVTGNAGNDEIHDGFGRDKLRGGAGDDRIELVGIVSDEEGAEGVDKAYGGKGKDNIRADGEEGFFLLYGGPHDDTIVGGDGGGKIYGGSGNDQINANCCGVFDVWGGSGDDEIRGTSECGLSLGRVFGGAGNDRIISPDDFTRSGPGNDVIEFWDCSGVAYGDSGNDEMRGGDTPVELHGGDGDDRLQSLEGGKLFGDDGDDTLRGGEVDTTLTGGKGADRFICGGGSDAIITDFNAAEGDTKTEGCENVLEESVSVLDNNNDNNNANTTETAPTTSTPTSEVAEDSSATEEDASSLPSTTTTPTSSSSNNNSTETIEPTGTVEMQ
jgi:Ca2+-binding RTX toxin-like protein